jgi:DNA sulfur modification protein DndE
MSPDLPTSVRVNQQAKDQLIKLKRITGIKQWNVLCRWALCASLADPSPPLVRSIRADSNVEMSWRTFAGPLDAAFVALLRHRMATSDEGFPDMADALTAHLHRGIGQLSGTLQIGDDVSTLARMALPPAIS